MIMLWRSWIRLWPSGCRWMSNDAILNHDVERALPVRSLPRAMISAPPVQPVFPDFHARRPVRDLPRGSHAAFDRICRAQAPGERRIRGDGAGDADLLRAARLELGRPGSGARARRKGDRTVRGMPLRGRALGLVRRDDPG